MKLHFQGAENDNIWVHTDGEELEKCLLHCAVKGVPHVQVRFESTDGEVGVIVIMHPDMAETDLDNITAHITTRLQFFADKLLNKIDLVA